MNRLWEKEYVIDAYSEDAAISKFVQHAPGEAITAQYSVTLRTSIYDLVLGIKEILESKGFGGAHLRTDTPRFIAVEHPEIFIAVRRANRGGYDQYDGGTIKSDIEVFTVEVVSTHANISIILDGIKAKYSQQKYAQIKWWYHDSNEGIAHTTTYIEKPPSIIRPEFYPGVKDPEDYIRRYLASDAAILLAAGPPGTGKTTLLRHMIYEHNLVASVVYDEHLMEKDQIFQNFLFGKEEDILIIEDADVILTSREADKNKLMSRFLNISDGLIKLPNKKIVFTTNIGDFNKVDQALMRPGRCFDVLHTRALNLDEARAAARAAGLPLPFEGDEYTLAELFNGRQRAETRKIGFRGR